MHAGHAEAPDVPWGVKRPFLVGMGAGGFSGLPHNLGCLDWMVAAMGRLLLLTFTLQATGSTSSHTLGSPNLSVLT